MNRSAGVSAGVDDCVVLTVIIVNYNTRSLLAPCIEAVRTSAGVLPMQIVIVDNASRDGSVELMKEAFADCDLLFNAVNVGFGRANNQACALARGRYVLLLNTDAFVAADTIGRTIRFLEANPDCGLLGVRLEGRDGSLQPSCRYFPTPWNEFLSRTGFERRLPRVRMIDDMAWAHDSVRECDWVPGCYYLVRKSVIDQVGLFDPRFFLYYEEVDHCQRVKEAGWKVVFFPDTTVVHYGGESAKSDSPLTAAGRQIDALQIESALLYHRKHHGIAGLCAAVALTTVGDALLALKWLLKGRSMAGARSFLAHTKSTWSLLRLTAAGLRPTR